MIIIGLQGGSPLATGGTFPDISRQMSYPQEHKTELLLNVMEAVFTQPRTKIICNYKMLHFTQAEQPAKIFSKLHFSAPLFRRREAGTPANAP
jgi:hypothetical protein